MTKRINNELIRTQENYDIIAINAGALAIIGGLVGGATYLATKNPVLAGELTLAVAGGGSLLVAESWLLAGSTKPKNTKQKRRGIWPLKKGC